MAKKQHRLCEYLSHDRTDTTMARITLHEGRNHQVKNMLSIGTL